MLKLKIMEKIIFNNRHNEEIIHNGKSVWLSRACAVNTFVFVYNRLDGKIYLLLNQRGRGPYDGYLNTPCGYLDWDELGTQAAVREVYEECGLYLPWVSPSIEYNQRLIRNRGGISKPIPATIGNWDKIISKDDGGSAYWKFSNLEFSPDGSIDGQPFYVSDTFVGQQNITLHYSHWFAYDGLPTLSDEHNEDGETTWMGWVELQKLDRNKLAFNQSDVYIKAMNYFSNNGLSDNYFAKVPTGMDEYFYESLRGLATKLVGRVK